MQEEFVLESAVDLGPECAFRQRIIALLDHRKTFSVNCVERASAVDRMVANINSTVALSCLCPGCIVVSHERKKKRTNIIRALLFENELNLGMDRPEQFFCRERRYRAMHPEFKKHRGTDRQEI